MSDKPAVDCAGEANGVLVLGLGNVLLGDDGVGAAAVARIERDYHVPPGVRLEDGGTLGLSLLGLLAESEHVILVDAVRTDSPPGTLVRLDGADVMDAVYERLSTHQVGVADLLEAARFIDRYPATVVLLGLVPDVIDLAVVRSSAVDAGLDALVAAIVRELKSLGHNLVHESQTKQVGIALFTVLLAISGCERKSPTVPAGLLTSSEAQHAGGIIFATRCAICHGVNGDGRGLRHEALNPPPANLTLPPWSEEAGAGRTYLAIRHGVPGTAMAPWPELSDQEIWNVVAYITTLKSQ